MAEERKDKPCQGNGIQWAKFIEQYTIVWESDIYFQCWICRIHLICSRCIIRSAAAVFVQNSAEGFKGATYSKTTTPGTLLCPLLAVTTLLPSIQVQHIAEIFPNNDVKYFTGKTSKWEKPLCAKLSVFTNICTRRNNYLLLNYEFKTMKHQGLEPTWIVRYFPKEAGSVSELDLHWHSTSGKHHYSFMFCLPGTGTDVCLSFCDLEE